STTSSQSRCCCRLASARWRAAISACKLSCAWATSGVCLVRRCARASSLLWRRCARCTAIHRALTPRLRLVTSIHTKLPGSAQTQPRRVRAVQPRSARCVEMYPRGVYPRAAVVALHPYEAAGERADPAEESEAGTAEGGQSGRAPPRGPGCEQHDGYIGKAGSSPQGKYGVSEEYAQRAPHTQGRQGDTGRLMLCHGRPPEAAGAICKGVSHALYPIAVYYSTRRIP